MVWWGTAQGLLALLTEKNTEIISYGLRSLHSILESEWSLIADGLNLITKLANDLNFSDHKNAALLASKTYYYIGSYEEAVNYAILADHEYNPANNNVGYTNAIATHSIKAHKEKSQIEGENTQSLKRILSIIFEDMIQQKKYKLCLCLTIEARFDEYIEKTLNRQPSLLIQAITRTLNDIVNDTAYQQKLLMMFTKFIGNNCLAKIKIAQLYLKLKNAEMIADIFHKLISSQTDDNRLIAYQLAFDIAENGTQKFRMDILDALEKRGKNIDSNLRSIITREKLVNIYLLFLFRNEKSDLQIINALKETRNNIGMINVSSLITSYSYMNGGTGNDNYYRSNVGWFSRSKKWTIFMTIAATGGIHQGHITAGLQIMRPFITDGGNPYMRGGGLYALGLIYANYSRESSILDIVIRSIKNAEDGKESFPVKHGGLLGLGLIGLGSQRNDLYRIARNALDDDTAPEVYEAAGYAIGMIMLGRGACEELEDLVIFANHHFQNNYCYHPKHNNIDRYDNSNGVDLDGGDVCEKAVRGVSLAIALMMYGQKEESDMLADSLVQNTHDNALLRECAAWVTALAYVGTASKVALKRLLNLVTNDTSPNVKRTAAIGIGFVFSKAPNDAPKILSMLSESIDPYVRSGTALALGIACAGTGSTAAIEILEKFLYENGKNNNESSENEENERLVAQNAMIAMALVIQQNQCDKKTAPYARKFRAYLSRVMEDTNTKPKNDWDIIFPNMMKNVKTFGLCAAFGILNAGGRNVVISCNSLRGGENSSTATSALAMFCNFNYWLPLAQMLPLAFHPTTIIGLDKDLNTPIWQVSCISDQKRSITIPSYDVEKELFASMKKAPLDSSKNTKNINEKYKSMIIEEEEEENYEYFDILENSSSITLNQLEGISLMRRNKYKPITAEVSHGIVMLKKTQ